MNLHQQHLFSFSPLPGDTLSSLLHDPFNTEASFATEAVPSAMASPSPSPYETLAVLPNPFIISESIPPRILIHY